MVNLCINLLMMVNLYIYIYVYIYICIYIYVYIYIYDGEQCMIVDDHGAFSEPWGVLSPMDGFW